jgi:hypothetical protein
VNLQDKAKACARVGIVDGKAGADLGSALTKWFIAAYVKGLTLSKLRDLRAPEAWTSFALLVGSSDKDLIAAVRKVDPNNTAVLKQTSDGIVEHLRQLSLGVVEPPVALEA